MVMGYRVIFVPSRRVREIGWREGVGVGAGMCVVGSSRREGIL